MPARHSAHCPESQLPSTPVPSAKARVGRESLSERRSVVRLSVFFFSSRRRHTRYWRDWSSDVCSSDLSNPESSRRGNLYGMIGMAIAVLATVLGPQVTKAGYPWILGAMVIGAAIGLYAARVVKMTQMPELVALMHSLVGLAAVLIRYSNYIDTVQTAHFH